MGNIAAAALKPSVFRKRLREKEWESFNGILRFRRIRYGEFGDGRYGECDWRGNGR